MKNLFISNLNKKEVKKFTSDFGLFFRKLSDKPFKKLCKVFTKANIIREDLGKGLSDSEYFESLDNNYIDISSYNLEAGKNNIVLERYPELDKKKPYIFVANHTCPEDIETILNVLDRNAYLVLGSVESLKYNPEMYLSFINGMIPFDIMDSYERKLLLPKMKRVLKTNSILIFPEGSHNYSPNNIINPLFDGPVNAAFQSNREIVPVTMLKENNVSFIDVGNPINIRDIEVDFKDKKFKTSYDYEKYYVNSLSNILRDKMATSMYHLMERHSKEIKREDFYNIEDDLRSEKVKEAFDKLKWKKDVFEAEYLVKTKHDDKKHQEIINSVSNLTLNKPELIELLSKDWILLDEDIKNKNVPHQMREYLYKQEADKKIKKLKKRKN